MDGWVYLTSKLSINAHQKEVLLAITDPLPLCQLVRDPSPGLAGHLGLDPITVYTYVVTSPEPDGCE